METRHSLCKDFINVASVEPAVAKLAIKIHDSYPFLFIHGAACKRAGEIEDNMEAMGIDHRIYEADDISEHIKSINELATALEGSPKVSAGTRMVMDQVLNAFSVFQASGIVKFPSEINDECLEGAERRRTLPLRFPQQRDPSQLTLGFIGA